LSTAVSVRSYSRYSETRSDEIETGSSGWRSLAIARAPLVGGVDVGVEQSDRDRLHAVGDELLDRVGDRLLVERLDLRTVGGHPPPDPPRVPQRSQRIGLDHPHPPVQRSGGPGAREVEDLLVAGRRQQAAGRALALEDQVGDDGRAVEDELEVLRRGAGPPAGLAHALEHAHRLVRRCREHLDQGHVAGVGVLHLHVGEGAAHVYSQPVSHEVS
jgi:hypothetical protein